jgi:uncharacterized protein
MTDTHFDTALHAFTTALSDRLRPGVATFADLFTEDGVIEVPFDGDGTAAPLKGRAAIAGMVEALRGVLRFEQVEFTHTYDVDVATVICEYQARLHRADLGASFRRRYISVITLRDGQIAHVREYGGPLIPLPS